MSRSALVQIPPDRPGGVGFSLTLPDGVEVVTAAPTFRAVEQWRGRTYGEIAVALFHPSLIMDRDGVLWEAVNGLVKAMVSAPRSGYGGNPYQLPLGSGMSWRADVVLERDDDGGVPRLPYHSATAIGHPDVRMSAALLVTIRAADERWPAGFAMLDSLRFSGRAAAHRAAPQGAFTLAF